MRHHILKEDVGKGLLGFGGFVARKAATDAVGPDLVGAATAAMRGFKKKNSLRSVAPRKPPKPPMDSDAPMGDGIVGGAKPKAKKQPTIIPSFAG
jgi:hypothetical protein